MAATVTGSVRVNVAFTQVNDSGFYSGQPVTTTRRITQDFAAGTNSNQADKIGVAVLTLTASNAQTLDLTTDLKDYTNTAINPAEIVTLTVDVYSTNSAATVAVKQGASNGWTPFIDAGNSTGLTLRASTTANSAGTTFVAPGDPAWAVNSTLKTLLFTPSAHAVTVTVVAAGRSA